jgi:tRNA-specific 2-thiouridylase
MSLKNNLNKKRVVVAMSGGVDSSLSLILLKKQGYDPVGLSLKIVEGSEESFEIAKNICQKLDTPHFLIDVSKDFKKEVIKYFLDELRNNRTPNPCVFCNPNFKFKKLIEWADNHNIPYGATGHYAKIRKNKKYELLKAHDENKDQSYYLSFLSQKQLTRIIFPLSEYTKNRAYKVIQKEGFEFFKDKKQSQDFCFLSGKPLPDYLSKKIGESRGRIKDISGKTVGRHNGLHFYTIGQRKGIGLAGGPWYVIGFDKANNVLIVSKNKKDLEQQEILLKNIHFISNNPPAKELRVKAKIRYGHEAAKARLIQDKDKKFKLIFDKSQLSVAPGQFAVFYVPSSIWKNIIGRWDNCLGGGEII